MEHIAPDIVSYEHAAPLQHIGIDDVREVCRRAWSPHPGGSISTFPSSLFTRTATWPWRGAWTGIFADGVESRFRGTLVFERRNGQWQMVHQHRSIPVTE